MSPHNRPLDKYRSMRDAAKTPEPVPDWTVADTPADHTGEDQDGRGDTFVIQEHHATALHWDVRLERDGVLVSWAVPKGLPASPKIRGHLAKQTEDHPLAYASFAGDIPRGEYGGGHVSIWDSGTYELEKWTADEVKVVFHGERVEGRYVFLHTAKPDANGVRGNDWLVRRMDPPQRPDWQPLPERVDPMLATAADLPAGSGWAYEFKWDGVRALAYVDGGRVRLLSRTGRDITVAYPEMREVGLKLGSTSVVLDGEIVAMGPEGRPSFSALQPRMHVSSPNVARRLAATTPVTYLPFDLLHLDGRPLLDLSYDERRALLEELPLEIPPSFPENGEAVLDTARASGLEGVVAKKRSARYEPGRRSTCWVKVRVTTRQDVVIAGWKPGEGGRAGHIGSLLLGVQGAAGLEFAGHVGTGFTQSTLTDLQKRLKPLGRETSPFASAVPREYARLAHWVEPQLVASVQFGEWTRDGRMRHPSYKGLRDDIDPSTVRREGTG
jgi:bifunctional non-homologous end joining protein LigD